MLDLRLPIGWFFLINAALLIGAGVLAPHPVTYQGKMINLNLAWGCVMGAFGLFMVALPNIDRSDEEKKGESATNKAEKVND